MRGRIEKKKEIEYHFYRKTLMRKKGDTEGMNFLILDVGTSSMRGILFRENGELLHTVQMEYQVNGFGRTGRRFMRKPIN